MGIVSIRFLNNLQIFLHNFYQFSFIKLCKILTLIEDKSPNEAILIVQSTRVKANY